MTGQSYRYRSEEGSPGVEWFEGWPGEMAGARIPYVPYHWRRAWACLTGEHRYHRTKEAAARCAHIILPRIEKVQIVGGDVCLDQDLLAVVGQRDG